MVNCRITGNHSDIEGGGVFNSRHTGENLPAELYMHNCLIAGNEADGAGDNDRGGGVFNGFEGNSEGTEAIMEMVHCTLLGNYAGGSYGGAVNVVSNSTMRFYNSISRDNTDADGGTGDFAENLFHEAGYKDSPHDANNFVADGTLPSIYNPGSPPTWTASDPVFLEPGTTTIAWDVCVYDPETGLTLFEVDDADGAEVGMLFKPDPDSPLMLVIQFVDTGTDEITCWGKRATESPNPAIDGKLYDLHIDDSGSAYDFGLSTYVTTAGDACDLDGDDNTSEPLPYDIEPTNARNQGSGPLPDAGAYEIVYP